MKVVELLEALEGMPEDAEVRIAQQPSWPMEYRIEDVVEVTVLKEDGTGSDKVVYIAEGDQIGYLPSEAARELTWKD